jgi:hypothetical protein
MRFLRNLNNPIDIILLMPHFSFDRMKLFMIESESLLRNAHPSGFRRGQKKDSVQEKKY